MFTRVAETLNFGVAARQLGVSSAMVTRGVAALEAHLEVRLLNRTTRHVSLTDAGHAYWQGCKDLLYRLDCLESTNLSAFLWARRLNNRLSTRLRESLAEQDSKLVHR
ncbi:LysR family transcriptional regulator [Burkholderia cenocepacia]|uniref:LysR family transcriptional regulator n=1 Tax=Burkholderia cenocepacia TaxID=95486 RepID=UPI0020123E4B|nr:LysR family transcriptional regulator [Burkholderia cenocepacia]